MSLQPRWKAGTWADRKRRCARPGLDWGPALQAGKDSVLAGKPRDKTTRNGNHVPELERVGMLAFRSGETRPRRSSGVCQTQVLNTSY